MSPLPPTRCPDPLPAIAPSVALPLIRHRLANMRRLDMSFVDSVLLGALVDLTAAVEQLSAALDETAQTGAR